MIFSKNLYCLQDGKFWEIMIQQKQIFDRLIAIYTGVHTAMGNTEGA